MIAEQPTLDAGSAWARFTERWAELGGAPVTGLGCAVAAGKVWLLIRVEGAGQFGFIRDDAADAADELFRRIAA